MPDPFSMFIGAVVGRAIGAAGVSGGVSLGHTLGRVISATVAPSGQGGSQSGGDVGDEAKSLLKQPLHILMPNLPKTAFQPVLQAGQYFATNDRGEMVGEGFKNVLDAIKHMDDLILAQRAQFISGKTGVPLTVNSAGEIVRASGANGGGGAGGWSTIFSSILGGAARSGAAASAGASAAGGAGAATAGGAGAAGGSTAGAAAVGVIANPVTAIAAAAVAIGAAAAVAPFAIRNWTENLLKSREELRRFDGQINASFARFEREELLRKRDTAFETSGTTSALAESVSDLKDDIRPLTDAAITVLNTAGIALAELARIGVLLLKYEPHLAAIRKAAELVEENTRKSEQALWVDFVDQIADGKFTGMQRDRRTRIHSRPQLKSAVQP